MHGHAATDARAALRVADDFLLGCGQLLLAWARCAMRRAAEGDDPWLAERRAVADHGIAWLLPQAAVHWHCVHAAAAIATAAAA